MTGKILKSSELGCYAMTPRTFPKSLEILKLGIEEEVSPGFVAGVWQKNDPDRIHLFATGYRRVIPSALPMHSDTIFDLASLTKVFATGTLAAHLVDRGWLKWDTPLQSILPQYPYSGIEVQHLLSHTAGLAAWDSYWEKIRSLSATKAIYSISIQQRQTWMKNLVFQTPPQFPVGEKVLYSDLSFLILGFALEEILQMPLDHAVERFVWKPMGIETAYFQRTREAPEKAASRHSHVAATELCPWRGCVLLGQVHDDNCWAMGGFGGHAGAFGAARDVLHFSRGLFQGFLTPETLKAVWTKVSQPLECERTLGWDTPSGKNSSAGKYFSKNSVGHLGFTGTSLWIDPDAELAIVLLSNRVHPSRENRKIKELRPRFYDAIRIDLTKTNLKAFGP